ncbi:MAG TPA: c-type cytochrome [Gaiellaceae bacterium]|nr:c-type cytochrome [Gaiellaceae bacterium]
MSRLSLIALLLAALVFALAGCGGGEEVSPTPQTIEGEAPEPGTTEADPAAELEGDPANGEGIYAANGCGGCHTFEAAGSSGNVGPNLDESGTDYERAVQVITNGSGAMPAFGDQLEPQEIADVAAFVTQD